MKAVKILKALIKKSTSEFFRMYLELRGIAAFISGVYLTGYVK